MKAIIYTSNTGFTEKYARMLSEKTGLPVFRDSDAKGKVEKGTEVFYMGWLMAGKVTGYKKAAKYYDVKAVCAVGMRYPSAEAVSDTIAQNHIADKKVFYLQGGYDKSRLTGIYRIMMKMMEGVVVRSLKKKTVRTQEEEDSLEMLTKGKDTISEESLIPIADWLRTRIG